MKFSIIKHIVISLAFLASANTALAHDGEDHGTPQPVVAPAGSALLSASGSGTSFGGVLKYSPFAKGDRVALTLYVLSTETNRPVGDATVSASLSDGDISTPVTFSPKQGGPLGVYTASVTPSSGKAMSWLFDVSTPDDSDLIAIGGFAAGGGAPSIEQEPEDSHAHAGDPPPPLAVILSFGTLLAIGAFAAGRMTARKGAPA